MSPLSRISLTSWRWPVAMVNRVQSRVSRDVLPAIWTRKRFAILADYTGGAKPAHGRAAEHGLSKGSLRNLRLQNNVSPNRRVLTSEQRQQALELYRAEESVAAIASELSSSY